MFGQSSTLALSVILALLATGCVAQPAAVRPNNCGEIEPCLTYFEGDCDSKGERQVCIKYTRAGTTCAAAFPNNNRQRWCLQNTFTLVRPTQNVFFCAQEVKGGDDYMFGIQSTFATVNTGSGDITITGANNPVKCEGFTSACSANNNNDFKLTFKTQPCPATTTAAATTTTTPSTSGTCVCSPFGNFGSCSVTCGTGLQEQRRSCSGCSSSILTTQYIPCNVGTCPVPTPATTTVPKVDGMWGPWGPWSACNPTCGQGIRSRSRVCNNPPPSGGGQGCVEPGSQTEVCNDGACRSTGGRGGGSGAAVRRCRRACPRQPRQQRRRCRRRCGGRG